MSEYARAYQAALADLRDEHREEFRERLATHRRRLELEAELAEAERDACTDCQQGTHACPGCGRREYHDGSGLTRHDEGCPDGAGW